MSKSSDEVMSRITQSGLCLGKREKGGKLEQKEKLGETRDRWHRGCLIKPQGIILYLLEIKHNVYKYII